MQLESNAFKQGQAIPKEFSCGGANISPELHWRNSPAETKSFALVSADPDAPSGTFYHWIICNIPASVTSIPKGGMLSAEAKVLANTGGKASYYPPCPPSGTHGYSFKIYALDAEQLECNSVEELIEQVALHKLDSAELVAPYKRK